MYKEDAKKLLMMTNELLIKMIDYNIIYNDLNNHIDRIVHYIINDLNNIISKYLNEINESGESDD